MLPATVHAALVVLFAWLVHLLFALVGIDLGGDIETQLATVIVAYILSLGGLSLFNKVRNKSFAIVTEEYHPPFV